MSTLHRSMGALETPEDVKLIPSGGAQVGRVIQVEAGFEQEPGTLVVAGFERLEDGTPGTGVDDGAVDERVVQAAELDEDLVHSRHLVESGEGGPEQVDRVVLPLVPLVPEAPA